MGVRHGYPKLFLLSCGVFKSFPKRKILYKLGRTSYKLGEITQLPIYLRPFIEVITPFLMGQSSGILLSVFLYHIQLFKFKTE